jgi:hypothetical protein
MKKQPKKYPMDGPPIRIQRLMMQPRKNHAELAEWLKSNPNTRPETAQLCKLKP